ncbi:AraC-type DNA-binding protein [Pustulibacterium marinum]|uniref:AraC-type DNA-binding protein n=1 Tax=Pustulibacterium marinum TaxID=1224947 RepID=A0A1I7H7S8_9FLAO|nr:AraC family transcriptional regulator [Pustulibacterium marinum]SFU56724.1 AraC-type DNA-binding protein [Pustulibacterium marinum]
MKKLKYSIIPQSETSSFFFDHVHISPSDQIAFHQHEELEISYILKGQGTRVIGDKMERFSQGEVIFIPSNVPHCWSFDADKVDDEGKIENITLIIHKEVLERLALNFPECVLSIRTLLDIRTGLSLSLAAIEKVQFLLRRMVKENDLERLSSLLLIVQAIATTAHVHREVGDAIHKKNSSNKLHLIHRYVMHNFQRHMTIEEVASTVQMSKSSFCIFFKREVGMTFITFLNEFRVKSACKMLNETDRSIAEICYAVGFTDIPHFNRTFKKVLGGTPTEFRRRILKV